MSWRTVKLKEVLKQYRIEHIVQNDREYKQVTISKHDGVKFRGTKHGKDIGRKRQFVIDLKQYPKTLMLVRQGVYDGAVGIAPLEVDGCIATENMPMFSIENVEIEYLRLIIASPYFKEKLEKIPTTGSAQKSIHERQILEIEIPYPEINEQLRIVDSFQENNGRIGIISTELTHQLDLVKQLRQSFLREAMQGKLTSEWRASHPELVSGSHSATELLTKIKAEKEQLIKEKKIKKQKPLPPIEEEEIPFEIPKNWVWCRLGDVVEMGRGRFSIRPRNDPRYFNGSYPFLQIGSLDENGSTLFSAPQTLNEKGLAVSKMFPKGTIAIAIVGGTIGNLGVLGVEMCFTDSMIGFLPYPSMYNQTYILNFLRFKQPEIKYASYQMAGQPNIKIPTLSELYFPLPPLSEQHRICAKLNELMQYCDKLEESIKNSQKQNEMLLQQVLREALEPNSNITEISTLRKCDSTERAILAGHIINQTNNENFGRVKFQKLLHLTEYHCKIDLGSNYIKKVAGPHDGEMLVNIESTLKRYNFYSINKTEGKVNYQGLGSESELDNLYTQNFSKETHIIDEFLSLFKTASFDKCEIISTLYAVWNNRIILQQEITDELLKEDFLNWDKHKAKYKDRLDGALNWMRKENIIPVGWGKLIDKPKK